MATKAAHKRLTREYASITKTPPPYIQAHPSETNILEWHYILTGPPGTPYEGGQYWGTLMFPSDYPFAPPAIRMHTPSGRFRCNERLCLSISDFHPKSFNPAWEVSTILLGVLSFMTGEDATAGSVSASEGERKVLAGLSRWENSTGHGSCKRREDRGKEEASGGERGFGAIRKNFRGEAFREQWGEVDEENWRWMEERGVDFATGRGAVGGVGGRMVVSGGEEKTGEKKGGELKAVGAGGRFAGGAQAQPSWVRRNGLYLAVGALFAYVIIARLMGER